MSQSFKQSKDDFMSCTVFWEDLEMSETFMKHLMLDDEFSEKFCLDLNTWLKQNATSKFNLWRAGVWFEQQQDAVHFKLRWHGQFK